MFCQLYSGNGFTTLITTATDLGGDQTIASLTINTTAPVGISGGNLTVSGATTINNGTLTIGNGSTNGALIGDITNNATLAFNRSDASTYSGEIDGTGNVNKLGNGALTLVGNNTYTGTTRILGGTLSIGDGGTTGSLGTGSVSNNSALVFNRSDSVTVSNTIRVSVIISAKPLCRRLPHRLCRRRRPLTARRDLARDLVARHVVAPCPAACSLARNLARSGLRRQALLVALGRHDAA